ncbi:hypothetical protein Hypma_006146 [Hypsizygus marmoreus]|uniref:Uncharacterized protein n=1 Tax=Hypsizygus marmoreus TaxID=39966 RepID=A0A369JZ51_HYPMA|nr:hypothetical protein Hypma_006146 [Hypsizygus marmoreus]
MPVALTPPSPVSPLRRSARLVQDISPTPVKPNPKLNTNLVHSASRKRPRALGHSIIMANPELPTPRNNKLAHPPSRKRREPPTDSVLTANSELPTPRMLRAEKRRRLSTPPTPPTPVRTPIPTRKRKAFSPSPLAEYTCDGDLPSPVSMNKKRKENSGVACTVTPTKSTRTSVIKSEVLTSERRHTRRSSLLAGIDVPPVTIPPPMKRKRERRTTAQASGSRLPSPPLPSLPQNSDPFSVIPPTILTKASSSSSSPVSLRTSPRRASAISLSSSFAMHVDAKSTTTSSDEEQGDASPSPSSSTAPPASPSPPSQSILTSPPFPTKLRELGPSTVLDEVRSSSSASPPTHVLHASPRRALPAETGEPRASTSSLVMHVDASAVASSGNEQVDAASAVDGEGLGSPVSLASVGALASSSTVASAPLASSSSPSSRTSPRQASAQPAGLVEPVSLAPLTSEGTLASLPESSTVLANAASSRTSPPPSQPLRTSPPRGFTAGPATPRPSASFTLHVDTSPVPTLDNVEQDDTWPELPTSTPAPSSPPTSPTLIRAPTPLRTKVVVHIPSVVVTPPTPPPLASGAPVGAPIPLSDEPVPRPHNPPPQLKIQIPDSEEQMPMVSDSVVPAIIMPPLPPLPAMSPPPQPMQMNMNVVVNVPPPPPPQVDLNGGVWKTACKTRVWELQRRYSPLTIRDLVAQEADDYFLRFGYPKVWNVSREAEGGDGDEEGEDWSEYESELSSDDEEEWMGGCGWWWEERWMWS